jgi:hypothetical protein
MIIPRIANFYKIQIRYFKRFFIFCSNFAKKVVSANRKSTNYQYANHKKGWVRKSPIHTVSRLRMSVLELKTTISPLPLTAKNQYPKFETNIPKKGRIARTQSQFSHSCVCGRYIPPILLQEICGPIQGLYKSLTEKEYINGIFVAVRTFISWGVIK